MAADFTACILQQGVSSSIDRVTAIIMKTTEHAPPRAKQRASSYDTTRPRDAKGRWVGRGPSNQPWVNIPSGSGSPITVEETPASLDLAALRESVRNRSRASSRAGSAHSGRKTPSIPEHVEVDQSVSPGVPTYDQNGSFLSVREDNTAPTTPARPTYNMALDDTPPRDDSLMDQMQQDLDDSLSRVSNTSSFERRIANGFMYGMQTHVGDAGYQGDRVTQTVDDILTREIPEPPILNEVPSDVNAAVGAQSASDHINVANEPAHVYVTEFSEFKQYRFKNVEKNLDSKII